MCKRERERVEGSDERERERRVREMRVSEKQSVMRAAPSRVACRAVSTVSCERATSFSCSHSRSFSRDGLAHMAACYPPQHVSGQSLALNDGAARCFGDCARHQCRDHDQRLLERPCSVVLDRSSMRGATRLSGRPALVVCHHSRAPHQTSRQCDDQGGRCLCYEH